MISLAMPMTDRQKQGNATLPQRRHIRPTSVLAEFRCENVHYRLDLPLRLFDLKSFFKTAGIPPNAQWSGILNPKERNTGYHIHFTGRVHKEHLHVTLDYYDRGQRVRNDAEPFAETIMQFLGSFSKEPTASAFVVARFAKPKDHWRSRFNLPFKVTMGESEVTIDGISLILPKNLFRAMAGFLAVGETSYDAGVRLARLVEFSTFDIRDEITLFNEATMLFLEQVT